MIVRWRRLLHTATNRTVETLRNQRPEKFQYNLTPQVVESTLSSCPSDTIALSFFLWCARQPNYFHDPRSLDRMVPAVRKLTDRLGSVDGVVREFESVGCLRKAQTFLVLMRIYWRGDMYRLVLEAFDEMGSHNYVPNTFARNIVLDVLFKIGRIETALQVFRDTQFPNFLTFNIAICNLCKLNDWLGVRGVLIAMVKGGFCPDLRTFSMVLACFRKAGRLMEMLQLLGFMIVSGKQLSVSIWTILIDGFCQIGRVDIASKLLENMVDSGCSPTVVTYTSLIKGFFESQMSSRAFGLLDAMLTNGCKLDLVLCNVLIDFLCKSRRYDDAIGIFLGLHKWDLKPDSYTLSSLMSILCSSGKIGLFPKLIAELKLSIDLVACNSLLNTFSKAGFPSQAVKFYGDMVDRGFIPDRYSYAGLLNGLCRSGRLDDAVNVYQGILVKDHCIDAHVHTVVIDGLIKGDKHHRAIRLFRKAVSENYCLDVVSYTVAIHGLFKGGRFEEACSLFIQMKQFGLVPSICTYNVMLRGLFNARDFGAVKQLLRDMGDAGIELDCISFNTIIGHLLKLHRARSALLVFMEMCDLGLKPSRATYLLIFNGLTCAHAEELEDLFPLFKHYLEDNIFIDSVGFELFDKLLRSGMLGMFCSRGSNTSVNTWEFEENNREILMGS